MTDLDYVRGCATYFRSQQWQHLSELLSRAEQRGHIHLFVNTCLHPHSLERLVKGCLELQGREINRGNEVLSPRPGWGTLHGIHPRGTPHFDMNWRFRPNVVLEPLEEADGEQGVYYGKLMLLFEEPEYSFDMSWIYSPDVVLAPCRRQIFPEGDAQYMIVPQSDLDTLLARDPPTAS